MASYAGDAKGYYSMAENAKKFIVNDADASMVPAIGAAPLLVGAAAGAFVNKRLQQSFGTAASLIGIGTGVLLMTKATLDYRNGHVSLKKAANVLLDLKAMDDELIRKRNTNIEDIRNSLNKTDQQKQADVAAEIEQYNNQVEKLMFMAKAAKLSIEDAKQKGGGIGRSFLGGILATGSSSAVAILGALGSTGLALPGALLGGAVIGMIMAGEGAIHADQIAEQQNRRYIDADMYADPEDQQRLMEEAEKNLKGDQIGDLHDLQLWEPDSEEDLKNKAMQKEAKKSEVFQDQMRDLYAAQKGYVHQSSAKSGIKGKLFGEIYDRAFSEAQEAMGEYYFLPAREEGAWFHYFVESITLSEDLPEDKQGVLGVAVSMINFTLPVGAFCLSPDGKVIFYRYTLMLEADRDTEHTAAMIRSSMLNVLQYAVRWADALDALEYGRMTLEEFTETFAEVISSASL